VPQPPPAHADRRPVGALKPVRLAGLVCAWTLLPAIGTIAIFELSVDRRLDLRAPSFGPEHIDTDLVRFYAPPVGAHTETGRYDDWEVLFERSVQRSVTYVYDRYGARADREDRDYPLPRNVAVIGDSFSFGQNVDWPHTLPALLGDRLPRANVFDLAVPGSSSIYYPDTMTAFRQRLGRRFDAVVVGVYTDLEIGDLPRVLAVRRYGDRVTFRGVAVGANLAERLSASRFARLRFDAAIALRRWSSTFNVLFPPRASEDFAVDLTQWLRPDRFDALASLLLDDLLRLAQAADLPPDRIVIWLIPSDHVLGERRLAQREQREWQPFFRETEAFWSAAAARLERAGFAVIDPRERIYRRYLTRGVYPFTVDGHFRSGSYELVANEIEPVLREILHGTPAAIGDVATTPRCDETPSPVAIPEAKRPARISPSGASYEAEGGG